MSMKSIQPLLLVTLLSLLVASCDKKVATLLEDQQTDGLANVKIIHASAYATNYSVQLKVNGTRVSNNITNATPFPGGGLNTGGASSPWYLALAPGNTAISMSIPKFTSEADSIPLFAGSMVTEADKYYSAFLTDTATNTQMVVVPDNLTLPAPGTSRYKFVNLMPDQPSLDLYVGPDKVADAIAYKATSPDFTLSKGDTARWYIRTAGAAPTSAPIAIYPLIAPTFAAPQTVGNQRILTVFARGYSGSTGNRAPNVSLLYSY